MSIRTLDGSATDGAIADGAADRQSDPDNVSPCLCFFPRSFSVIVLRGQGGWPRTVGHDL